jgi:hypothetical protein
LDHLQQKTSDGYCSGGLDNRNVRITAVDPNARTVRTDVASVAASTSITNW